ncbi:MAG: glycosyltransferase family 39 protein, partial [Chloroflexota bacterium]
MSHISLKYVSHSPLHAPRSTLHALRSPLHALRSPLLLVLLLFTLLTLYNSALLPLGEAADETDHYQYLRFIARTGHPPLTGAERQEAGFKGGLAPLYYWLVAWPIALVGEDSRPDIRRVDSRPERHLPTDGLGFNHVLHTLDEGWPWRGQVLAWHWVRFLSLPLGGVTIVATYALARRLLPAQEPVALGAATFVAFLPRFVISSAVINDDNLVFALTALLLLTQVAILQGDHRPRTFAFLGALFGLSL